jgi:hypothetical protein
LLVQLRNVVIPLSLIEISSDWCAEAVFLHKLLDLETPAVVTGAIRKAWLIESQLSGLLVDEEDIAMEARLFWRPRAHVVTEDLSFGDVTAGNVADEPVVPLAVLRVGAGRLFGGEGFVELVSYVNGVAYRIWIGHAECVEGIGLSVPLRRELN